MPVTSRLYLVHLFHELLSDTKFKLFIATVDIDEL